MRSILAIICLLTVLTAEAQPVNHPQGVYMSLDEILTKEPSVQAKLTVIVWDKMAKDDRGINDYALLSEDGAVKNKAVNKLVRAYSDGEHLYVNCRLCQLAKGYSKVLSAGKFLVFKAANKKISNRQKLPVGLIFNLIGGIYAADAAGPMNGGMGFRKTRLLYALDLSSGCLIYLNPELIAQLLIPYPELSDRFGRDWETVRSLLKEAQAVSPQFCRDSDDAHGKLKEMGWWKKRKMLFEEADALGDSLLIEYLTLLYDKEPLTTQNLLIRRLETE